MPAPFLETPPNPVESSQTTKVRTGRYGELEEHEIVRLLDTLDDERSKARFRESIYISVFVYIIVSWFVFYGPRILFHQPRLVNPFDVLKQREMTELQVPRDIAKQLQQAQKSGKAPKQPAEHQVDQKTLQAMRKAAPAPKPLPATPQPQQAATPPPPPPVQQAQQTPLPQIERPTQPQLEKVPDAPKPSPNFGGGSKSAGSTIRDAIQGATKDRGGNGDYSNGITPSKSGVGTGVDILSDTMGVNFDPYLKKIMRQIYNTWIPLIPEEARPPLNKQGVTQLRITIMPDGRLHVQDGSNDGMVLEGSSHDDALNRAAWGSVTGVGQFPPLPSEFHGPNLTLRIHYLVNMKQE
ncbi:TonB C-terminal domain-containing protein [Granulicella arctica]|uniref:TonB C-terminal domain-containing protein n=1 Tax=Granulicella arctica TaxID=940613 RepID=UPI0021E052E2|nr:TonB C-terminal domain-containing protein [Granulicella arctica]